MAFANKTVVITGASAGIGAAAARRFAGAGAAVVLAARGPDALEEIAAQIRASGGQATCVPTDVADPDACARLLETAERTYGAIHVVVNNAGYNRRGAVEDVPAADLAAIVDVNLRAPIVLSRLAVPHLRRAGGGAIVNVASIAGRIPLVHEAVYSATKFGLRAFTLAMAQELEGTGVTVSAVSPGPVDTGFIRDELDEVPDVVFSQPMSSADDVAALIVASAADGKPERTIPRVTGYLATLGYLIPSINRALTPVMARLGRRAKAKYAAGG